MEKRELKLHIPAIEGAVDAFVSLPWPDGVDPPKAASVELVDEDGNVEQGVLMLTQQEVS